MPWTPCCPGMHSTLASTRTLAPWSRTPLLWRSRLGLSSTLLFHSSGWSRWTILAPFSSLWCCWDTSGSWPRTMLATPEILEAAGCLELDLDIGQWSWLWNCWNHWGLLVLHQHKASIGLEIGVQSSDRRPAGRFGSIRSRWCSWHCLVLLYCSPLSCSSWPGASCFSQSNVLAACK